MQGTQESRVPFQALTVHQFEGRSEIVILCKQLFTLNQSLSAFTLDKGVRTVKESKYIPQFDGYIINFSSFF